MIKRKREGIAGKDILFALVGGALLSASQPPLVTSFLAYFCLVPLFVALRNKTYRAAFGLGYIWGFVSNLMSLYWIALPTAGGMVAAVIILSLYNAGFALLYSFLERRREWLALAASPIFWTGMEFLRGYGRLGFPWMDLAYTQGQYAPIIQIADLVGHRGITFWLVIVNVLVFAIFTKKRKWVWGVLLALAFGGVLGYGFWKLSEPPSGEMFRVALLQSNITATQKWESGFRRKNVRTYVAMMDSLAEKVDLVVLPESATAYYHRNRPDIIEDLRIAAARHNTPILSGTLDFDPERRKTHYYNSAMVITPAGLMEQVYHKMELVPMSEQIPFQDVLPGLREIDVGGSHFARGSEYTIFDVRGTEIGAPICFEAAFPRSIRNFRRAGAEVIINITNDGWFGITPGPYQHANFIRFRAVENRIGIARCAQTGISLIASPKGIIEKSLPLGVRGALIGEVQTATRKSFFSRAGDWVGTGSLIATPLLMIIFGFLVKL